MGGKEKATLSSDLNLLILLTPQVGLEPTTLRLTAGCSAIELLRIVFHRRESFDCSTRGIFYSRPFTGVSNGRQKRRRGRRETIPLLCALCVTFSTCLTHSLSVGPQQSCGLHNRQRKTARYSALRRRREVRRKVAVIGTEVLPVLRPQRGDEFGARLGL